MEPVGAFPEGEWDFSRIFSTEELDFAPEFLGNCLFPLEQDKGSDLTTSSAFCPNPEANESLAGVNESLFYASNAPHSNLHFISHEHSNSSNCTSTVFIPSDNLEPYSFTDINHFLATNDMSMSMDISIMDDRNGGFFVPPFPEIAMTETACISEDISSDTMGNLDDSQPAANAVPTKELQLKRKFDITESNANASNNTKKKPRVTRHVQNNRKDAQSKKNQKFTPNCNDDGGSNAGPDGQSSGSYSSEDENASQDSNGVTSESKVSEALNSNGKTRASRGSATDPQSLYARKRRERINERLKILQNLVPNGTKVEISTMLEEAVHYVKFLQLQIKLLSSDDLWMYAPIAYNGVDIGLNQKFSTFI